MRVTPCIAVISGSEALIKISKRSTEIIPIKIFEQSEKIISIKVLERSKRTILIKVSERTCGERCRIQ